jgi:uncharacterized membrane protein YfcA
VTNVTDKINHTPEICDQIKRVEIFGYIASLLIGISLGLIGGGGSILTIPVMVYLFGIQPLAATSYSLFVVGSTSLVGAIQSYKRGLVNNKATLLFGASSVLTVFATRKFVIPLIPQNLFSIGPLVITSNLLTMLLFGVLMILAAVTMIKTRRVPDQKQTVHKPGHRFILILYGIGIGIITGVLGAGGGFLLIPALVLFVGLPMKQAIGTSLVIIALNSLVGFTGDIHSGFLNWKLLLSISSLAIVGIIIGTSLSKQISSDKLRKGFAWFVLAMGIYIIIKELIIK